MKISDDHTPSATPPDEDPSEERQPSPRASVEIFQPLVMRKAVDEVMSVLVDAIHGGLIEPGDRFPREVDLAARLDVSRNTVNQAMARLEHAGVVSVRRGSQGGAVVISHSVPPELLVSDDGEETEVNQWLYARRPIETQATLLAARRVTDEQLADLRRLVEMLPALVDDDRQFMSVDLRFHAELGRLSGNALLATYLDDLMRRFLVLRTRYPVGRSGFKEGIDNQRMSMDALESRDEQRVLDVTDAHIGAAEEHFLGSRLPRWEPR